MIVTTMKNNRVDGLIVSLGANTTTYDHFTALKKYGIPVVFFDRVPTLPDFNKVYSNMNSGTREAIEFLIAKGHRRIGVLNGPEQMRSSQERTETYMQVLVKRRLKIDLGLVTSTDLTREGDIEGHGPPARPAPPPDRHPRHQRLHRPRRHAIRPATKAPKINKDICFVSYANLSITTYLQTPPMASVEQYPYRQGAEAAEILMELLSKTDRKKSNPDPLSPRPSATWSSTAN
jgi:DNA-binding LacI/PurR family transcriptional regulator